MCCGEWLDWSEDLLNASFGAWVLQPRPHHGGGGPGAATHPPRAGPPGEVVRVKGDAGR